MKNPKHELFDRLLSNYQSTDPERETHKGAGRVGRQVGGAAQGKRLCAERCWCVGGEKSEQTKEVCA